MHPHGFETREKFLRYLQCLKNITTKSVVTISPTNHISGIPTAKCGVALIEIQEMSYGSGWLLDRRIILMSPVHFLGGKLSNDYDRRTISKLEIRFGLAIEYYYFKTINETTLVVKIDNRPEALSALGAQNRVSLPSRLGDSIRLH